MPGSDPCEGLSSYPPKRKPKNQYRRRMAKKLNDPKASSRSKTKAAKALVRNRRR